MQLIAVFWKLLRVLAIVWSFPSLRSVATAASNYNTTISWQPSSNWQILQPFPLNATWHSLMLHQLLGGDERATSVNVYASKPVLASLTSISSRIHRVHRGLVSLLRGFVVPHEIYLFVSQLPFLIDQGVREFPDELLCLAAAGYVKVVYAANIGPHRKLLPLLQQRYREDVLIVTIDDDLAMTRNSTLLFRLLQAYEDANGTSVAALRSRRVGLCLEDKHTATRYRYWSLSNTFSHPEMLSVPTGTGGVLYHPQHLHPIVFDEELRERTGTADDLMFRLACMLNNVSVVLGCTEKKDRPCQGASTKVRTQSLLQAALCSFDRKTQVPPGRDTSTAKTISSAYKATVTTSTNTDTPRSSSNSTRLMYDSKKVQSLFVINIKGQNDASWRRAVHYLQARLGFDWGEFLGRHYYEREAVCYDPKATLRWGGIQCAAWPCNHRKLLYI